MGDEAIFSDAGNFQDALTKYATIRKRMNGIQRGGILPKRITFVDGA